MKEGVKLCQSESCADAFDRSKRGLISAPVLAFPNFDEQFLLQVDASSTGIGFALTQIRNGKEVVFAYSGRGLNQAERNYTTTEREALALVEGIKKLQPYLHEYRSQLSSLVYKMLKLLLVDQHNGLSCLNNKISQSFTVRVVKLVTLRVSQYAHIQTPT